MILACVMPLSRRASPRQLPLVAPVRASLLDWYRRSARDLPWRRTQDPYAIWVSEVMLQQTRVDTVAPYFVRFLERFPSIRQLADAPVQDVMAAWSGLGYYRRARMLHEGARAVRDRHAGQVPHDVASLRALPGVGPYTAGAIASIAFDLREGIVDGNVERVISRLFEIGGDPRSGNARGQIWAVARAFADCDVPGDTNQALMELGATICTPAVPNCLLCPARPHCGAFARGEQERFPEKPRKKAARVENWLALVLVDPERGDVWLDHGRTGRWTAMLLPPMARSVARRGPARVARAAGLDAKRAKACGYVRHDLTHASMRIRVFVADLATRPSTGVMVAPRDLGAFAVPKVTRVILQKAGVLEESAGPPATDTAASVLADTGTLGVAAVAGGRRRSAGRVARPTSQERQREREHEDEK